MIFTDTNFAEDLSKVASENRSSLLFNLIQNRKGAMCPLGSKALMVLHNISSSFKVSARFISFNLAYISSFKSVISAKILLQMTRTWVNLLVFFEVFLFHEIT